MLTSTTSSDPNGIRSGSRLYRFAQLDSVITLDAYLRKHSVSLTVQIFAGSCVDFRAIQIISKRYPFEWVHIPCRKSNGLFIPLYFFSSISLHGLCISNNLHRILYLSNILFCPKNFTPRYIYLGI